jgi:diaminopimelate decarboxylase
MNDYRIPHGAARASAALASALAAGLLGEEDTAAVFYDLDALDSRFEEVKSLFPAGTLHAAAVKACPLPALLERMAARGAGLEAASLPELRLALACGCPSSRIVFDSPAKTVAELREALELGVHVNADNFQELTRLDALMAEQGGLPEAGAFMGLRVNPQVGEGAIAATSVAGEFSKFGEPIVKGREIVEAFLARPWLTGLHMHVGSQGCGVELFTRAARAVLDLRREINRAAGCERVTRLDIGGGLPVRYAEGDEPPSMAQYAAALKRECPELFAPSLSLATEFGRWFFANQGFAASRVEYVKEQPGHRTAVTHLGADMFLRPCYAPENWRHEIAIADPSGALKTGPVGSWHVAGPLCFSGDFLARSRPLPGIAPGDFVIAMDAGAYCLSMWSRYNSRQMPVVLGVEGGRWLTLKKRESADDVARFWR